MKSISLEEVCRAVRGKIQENPSVRFFNSISTDSRRMTPKALFVALRGDNFDGHAFLSQAASAGAAAAIVDHLPQIRAGLPCIVVDDTRKALGRLGALVRKQVA